MQRWLYRIEVRQARGGWTARVSGTTPVWSAGPFPSADAAHRAVWRLVCRWQARARSLGGFVWLGSGSQLGVALPQGRVARAALPFEHAPCAVPATGPRSDRP